MIHILLPAYNEEEGLAKVLDAVKRHLGSSAYRVWVVDDGSTDQTAKVAGNWSKEYPLTLISHQKNAGLGQAFQTGLEHVLPAMAPADVLVTLDADNTHPVELIPALVQPIETKAADLAIASRYVAGGRVVGVPFYRQVTSLGVLVLFRLLLPIPGVLDYTCGFRAYDAGLLRRGMEKWGKLVTEKGFAATLEWLVRLSVLKPRIVEKPLVLRYDQKPTPSKMPVLQTIGRIFSLLFRMRRLKTPA